MVASIRHQVICLVCPHHIWFCLADRLPVPTGRLARRNSYIYLRAVSISTTVLLGLRSSRDLGL